MRLLETPHMKKYNGIDLLCLHCYDLQLNKREGVTMLGNKLFASFYFRLFMSFQMDEIRI